MKPNDDDLNELIDRNINPTKKKQDLPPKLRAEDAKRTLKMDYTSSREFRVKELINKLIRESEKLDNAVSETYNEAEVTEYNPCLVLGSVKDKRNCTIEQEVTYGLKDVFCYQFEINEHIRVVMAGRQNIIFTHELNVSLYLPEEFYKVMEFKKSSKQNIPKGLIDLGDDHWAVVIRRQIRGEMISILSYPLLILEQNQMLYPSYICSWIPCKRLIALKNYVEMGVQPNRAMAFGVACHRMLEWLADQVVTFEQFQQNKQAVIQKLFNSLLYDMYLVQCSLNSFSECCEKSLSNIANLYNRHIMNHEQLEIDKYKKIYLQIEKVVGSQIMFRSYRFGLKGKVDLLLYGRIVDRKKNTFQQVYVPMQLKTGKGDNHSHKRQVDIYNILVREQYKKPVLGMLFYSQSNQLMYRQQDPLVAYQIIVIHRNQIILNLLALYNDTQISLPRFQEGFVQCKLCQYSSVCEMFAHLKVTADEVRLEETQESKSMPQLSWDQKKNYEEKQHNSEVNCVEDVPIEQSPGKYHESIQLHYDKMTKPQLRYFKNWMRAIHHEQLEHRKQNSNYNRMGITEFSLASKQLLKIQRGRIDFEKIRVKITHKCRTTTALEEFQNYYKIAQKIRVFIPSIGLIEGCKIVDTGRDQITFILLLEMNQAEIDYNQKRLQFFIEESGNHNVIVEKLENSFFASMRGSVYEFLTTGQDWLRRIVVEDDNVTQQKPIQCQIDDSELQTLNKDQAAAYIKACCSSRYCLIQGMPGTGKTELILKLIEKFHSMDKLVLVSTFTNRALDNILTRLLQSGKIPASQIIRQGTQYSNKQQDLSSRNKVFNTVQDYTSFFNDKKIWLVTLASLFIHHLPRKFDVVIVDEASQCLQPACLDAIMRADRFILVGDYKQLRPLVRSRKAERLKMGLSLFERLCLLHPQDTVSLTRQYRMTESIMSISNTLVYSNQLQAANKKIANQQLQLPQTWQQKCVQSFHQVIDPQMSVCFINIDRILDSLRGLELLKKDQIRKILEVQLASFVYKIFTDLRIPRESISVISAYNASVYAVIQQLRASKTIQHNDGNVLTIDKSQGIEKQIVVLLIQQSLDGLIESPQRLNVALTRAKSKLVIIASEEHLEKMKVWQGSLADCLARHRLQLTTRMIQDMLSVFRGAVQGVAQQC